MRLAFTVLVSLLLVCFTAAQPPGFFSAPITITAVSGSTCTSTPDNTAVNCTTPFVLTINGTGLGNNMEPRVVISAAPYSLTVCGGLTVDPAGEWLTCGVYARGYGWLPQATTLSLFMYDLRTGAQLTAPLPSLSLAYVPPPVLISINSSACQSGGGEVALLCDPSQATLVITGTSLGVFISGGPISTRLCIRNSCGIVTGIQVFNDTLMTVPIRYQYELFLLAEHYNNTLLPLTMRSGTFVSNALTISFVELPPPVITSLGSQRGTCSRANNQYNQTALFGCSPLADSMVILGKNMYEVQNVTIGGVLVNVTSARGNYITVVFPYLPNYVPGLLYDLTMTVGAYVLSRPAAVSFNADPLVTEVSYCIDPGADYYSMYKQCTPGTTITISGANLVDQPISVLIYPNYTYAYTPNPPSVACLSPLVTSSSTITCTLPELAASVATYFQGAANRLLVSYPQNSTLSASFLPVSAGVYQLPNAAFFTTIAGCGPAVTQTVLLATPSTLFMQCAEGSVLTVTGQHFLQYRAPPPMLYSAAAGFTAFDVNVTSDTLLTVQLPWLDQYPNLQYSTQYTFRLVFNSFLTPAMTQPFYVTMSQYVPVDPQTSGGMVGVRTIVPAVVVPVVVLLVALGAVLVWRRQRKRQAGSSEAVLSGYGRSSEEVVGVEMR